MLTLILLLSPVSLYAQNYSSSGISFLSSLDLRGGAKLAKSGNDIWGWTDPETLREYALMGLDSKTAIVDLSDPENPVHVADIATATYKSLWRDVKVFKNYALIVSEAYGHGLQIVDLTKVRGLEWNEGPILLKPEVVYKEFGNAHNIFVNEKTGYAYAVGTSTCDGGLHIVNISDPLNPVFSTCVGRGVYEVPWKKDNGRVEKSVSMHGDAYTHDVQCVIYHGPDQRYQEREICVASNEDTVNIVDVTDKSSPKQIGVASYQGVAYTHQGWLSEDHTYFYLGDELDEQNNGTNTRTFIWNLSDLEKPKVQGVHEHETKAIDHNMYVKDGLLYQSNYTDGLRVFDISKSGEGVLTETAYIDFWPKDNSAKFAGAWSVYPFFNSGTIVVSGIDDGTIYVVRLN